MSGPDSSRGANDVVEELREGLRENRLMDEAVLDAAYDAGEIDTPMLFAYFEGGLTAEERRDLEAQAAGSPHLLSKMARVGRVVAQSRTGGRAGL